MINYHNYIFKVLRYEEYVGFKNYNALIKCEKEFNLIEASQKAVEYFEEVLRIFKENEYKM